jgi:hypothetical protein
MKVRADGTAGPTSGLEQTMRCHAAERGTSKLQVLES